MRYLILTHLHNPNGSISEVADVAKNISKKHICSATAIIDFKERKVVKSRNSATYDDYLVYLQLQHKVKLEYMLQANHIEYDMLPENAIEDELSDLDALCVVDDNINDEQVEDNTRDGK